MSNMDSKQVEPTVMEKEARERLEKRDDSGSEKGSKSSERLEDGLTEKVNTKIVPVGADSSDAGSMINLKGLSWQKCTALLFGEYVCLAILAVPSSFAVLGMAGGILTVLGLGLVTLYTSLTLWKYCMRHPDQLSIADIGGRVFARKAGGFSRIAFEFTAIVLLLNNIFIMGFHTLTGAKIINTLSTNPGSGWCSVALSVIVMVVCACATLPRKLEQVATMSIVSAISMSIAILLTIIFTGIQGRSPVGLLPEAPVIITAWAPEGTTFVDGLNAALNITFLWIGQICYPSFIAEMRDPREFPKALYCLTVVEFLLFTGVGIFVYAFAGQYSAAPAVTILSPTFKKIAFAFVFPTTIIIGVIYASVACKYVFARIFVGTRHFDHHTVLGWTSWIAIVFSAWTLGWLVGEGIPVFGLLLSLMSALFDSYIGFVIWAVAYLKMHQGELWSGQSRLRKAETAFNIILIPCGIFLFGPGIYTSVQALIISTTKAPFTCANNGA